MDHLFAMDILAEYVEGRYAGRPMTVVAPDSGRVRVAERWTDRLGGCPLAFIHKTRDPLKPNQVVANRVVGDVEGRVCLIVDDMIDTGGTICKAAEILHGRGRGRRSWSPPPTRCCPTRPPSGCATARSARSW